MEDNFARNLRALRKSAGLSQEEVAAKLVERGFQFHQATVTKLENGTRRVQLGEAMAIAEVLDVKVEHLVAETQGHLVALAAVRRWITWAEQSQQQVRTSLSGYQSIRAALRTLLDGDVTGLAPADAPQVDAEDMQRALRTMTVEEVEQARAIVRTDWYERTYAEDDEWTYTDGHGPGLDRVKDIWSKILKAVKDRHREAWIFLIDQENPFELVETREFHLVLEFARGHSLHAFLDDETRFDQALEGALGDMLGGTWTVQPRVKPTAPRSVPDDPWASGTRHEDPPF